MHLPSEDSLVLRGVFRRGALCLGRCGLAVCFGRHGGDFCLGRILRCRLDRLGRDDDLFLFLLVRLFRGFGHLRLYGLGCSGNHLRFRGFRPEPLRRFSRLLRLERLRRLVRLFLIDRLGDDDDLFLFLLVRLFRGFGHLRLYGLGGSGDHLRFRGFRPEPLHRFTRLFLLDRLDRILRILPCRLDSLGLSFVLDLFFV